MEIKWIIIVVVSVCVIALVIFLIKRNEKDKADLVTFLNKTDAEQEIELKEEEEK